LPLLPSQQVDLRWRQLNKLEMRFRTFVETLPGSI
jgi:hypothetical protein